MDVHNIREIRARSVHHCLDPLQRRRPLKQRLKLFICDRFAAGSNEFDERSHADFKVCAGVDGKEQGFEKGAGKTGVRASSRAASKRAGFSFLFAGTAESNWRFLAV